MDSGMVEENGNASLDPLAGPTAASADNGSSTTVLTSGANIVQLIPSTGSSIQAQSVIQANQQSVIQTATNIQPMTLSKSVLLVSSKPSSVIHTAQGSLQAVHAVHHLQIKPEPNFSSSQLHGTDTNSDDSFTDDESPRKRRDLLKRRASYRALQISNVHGADGTSGLHTLSTGGSGGTIVQYTQSQDGQQFFVPAEDQSRKREMRLMKNREAARECRRKKKEYIKCLENRVAVLENQNKALIEELKSLKELYCQQKSD